MTESETRILYCNDCCKQSDFFEFSSFCTCTFETPADNTMNSRFDRDDPFVPRSNKNKALSDLLQSGAKSVFLHIGNATFTRQKSACP